MYSNGTLPLDAHLMLRSTLGVVMPLKISFSLNLEDISPVFDGPLIPLFLTCGDICPRFQSQSGMAPLLAYFMVCMQQIPQIHL